MYPNSAATSPRMVSITRNDRLKVIRVRAAGRTLWGDDHYVDPVLRLFVRTVGKKFDYGFITGDLDAFGFTVDPSGNFLHRVAENIFPPELDISSL